MKIKTITCHDVYNAGASLQAYALMTYLRQLNHDVEIIDYKPDYLSHHYDLWYVANPRYRNVFLIVPYLLLKLPSRLKEKNSKKKKEFDKFRDQYLSLTKRYNSYEELVNNNLDANIFLAGSDQIWNNLFQNGNDQAFYLQFASKESIKASYAASFAIEEKDYRYDNNVKQWLSYLDYIAVRETSALNILNNYGLNGVHVLDPVFLLKDYEWDELVEATNKNRYIFVNDFDDNENIKNLALYLAEKHNAKIISLAKLGYEDEVLNNQGPIGFISAIKYSVCVISNSFHATAFSLIFHKDFYVMKRNESINARMLDILCLIDCSDRMLSSVDDLKDINELDWNHIDSILEKKRQQSYNYLNKVLEKAKEK